MIRHICLLMGVGVLVGCTAGAPEEETLSREEARRLYYGSADHYGDLCEIFGFYGDGICDDFCSAPDPDCTATEPACVEDADCPNGYCAHFATCLAIGCPPPPPSQCVTPDCGDGTDALCRMLPPTCGPGETVAVIGYCYSCVDARTCEPPTPPSCDDGTMALCAIVPPTCADDEILAVINHCYSCVDPVTCEPPAPNFCEVARCAAGYECDPVREECVAEPQPEPGCVSDSDCPADEYCGPGICYFWCPAEESSCCEPPQCLPR